SFFPPLTILSHLNFFKQWVMSIFCKFFVVNSYKFSNIPHYCAVNLNSKEDLKKLDELAKLGEPRILLDAQNQNQIGGTGTQIDEELLSLVSKKYKLWIAGGINSENVNHLISNFHPELIDVSSSLEIEPGIKSEEKIKFLCQQFIDKKTK
ncbi:MAG: hypothetical protein SPE03_10670, partial [Treponema sp.]|nr:hypothetical protein [Treponema sp.]